VPEDGPAERVGPQDAIADGPAERTESQDAIAADLAEAQCQDAIAGGPEERAEPRAVIAADPQAEELAAELVRFSVAPKVARCA
jgi:hypothetical protein